MDSTVIRFGILTVSDRCSIGEAEDKSGLALVNAIKNHSGFSGSVIKKACVPDNVQDIMDKLILWSDGDSGYCDVILTTGGTGFAPRDVTPEATLKVVTKRCDTLAMIGAIRSKSPFAYLSRAAAGIIRKTIVINFPGSVRGATECFEIVAPLLPHAVHLVSDNVEAVSHTHSLVSNAHTLPQFMPDLHMHHPVASLSNPHSLGFNSKLTTSSLSSSVSTDKSGLRPRQSQWPMISLEEAQKIVLEAASQVTPSLDNVPLMESLGRIGRDCTSTVNLPPFRASIKDGYAVRVADGTLPRVVVSASSAGDQSKRTVLEAGECVRINTGAPLPPGADAVVQVEDTSVLEMSDDCEEMKISILKAPSPGLDIREIGSDMADGCVLTEDGDKITSSCLGVLASAGYSYAPCWSVRVCIFSTGDELTEPGQPLENGKIYDSNRQTLISLLRENSFPVTDGGIIRDKPDEIYRRLFKEMKGHDVLITSGSVSMGDKDYLKRVLVTDLKASIHFGRIDLKPGKPTTFASLLTEEGEQKLIFSLPGNPVSAAVTCHLLVLPALRKITKHKIYFSPTIKAQVSEDVKFDETRKEFKRASITFNPSGLPIASVTGGQASSRLGSMLEANALITCDKATPHITKGSTVDALIFSQLKFTS